MTRVPHTLSKSGVTEKNLLSLPWQDYELLDSGDTMKLERFGSVIVARPETQALWAKRRPELWQNTHALFSFSTTKGSWEVRSPLPEPWIISFADASARLKLTPFKHTGIFPEQAPNWAWVRERTHALEPKSGGASDTEKPHVLHLFGYTGMMSVVVAKAGARVTHVDSSKQSVEWARENARLSNLPETAIRFLTEDALAFSKREARRGTRYNGIILDPPAFGRGAKGEVWRIEKDLPALLASLRTLLSDAPGSFFLLSGYAAGYAPHSFAQAVESAFEGVSVEAGELQIQESSGERVVPAGISVRFTR